MDKKQQLLHYLDSELFAPVLHSPYASSSLKQDFKHTREILEDFSAEGILYYIWNNYANHDTQLLLSDRLLDEGFVNCNKTLDHFKTQFTYDWLLS